MSAHPGKPGLSTARNAMCLEGAQATLRIPLLGEAMWRGSDFPSTASVHRELISSSAALSRMSALKATCFPSGDHAAASTL